MARADQAAAMAVDQRIVQLGCRWAALHGEVFDLEDDFVEEGRNPEANADLAAMKQEVAALLEEFIATPSQSIVGIAAKLRASVCFRGGIRAPSEEPNLFLRFLAAALMDAERLAGGTNVDLATALLPTDEEIPLITQRP